MSYALGFRRLGHEVLFVEQIAPSACVDRLGQPIAFTESHNAQVFQQVMRRFGFWGSSGLLLEDGSESVGLSLDQLRERARGADLLVNISGHMKLEALVEEVPITAFVDQDPGFTQIWHASGDACLAKHDYYFTIGENVGRQGCLIPLGGLPWRATRQPVVLEEWPTVHSEYNRRFTTIANWRGPYGALEYQGQTYGLKVHEFRKFLELPTRVAVDLELALDIDPADGEDLKALEKNGWAVKRPEGVVGSPESFRDYIRASDAEFSVAQGVYVGTKSGWFSDRSVRYLACGKPVVVQDTGFSDHYPVGEGILAFQSLDDAVAAVEEVDRRYQRHATVARELAEEWFDSDKVLTEMLDQIS